MLFSDNSHLINGAKFVTIAQLEFIENIKHDSRKMFQAIKTKNRQDSKSKLLIDGEHGQTSNPKQQVKIVTSFFKIQLNKDAVKKYKKNENTIYTFRNHQRSKKT